MTYTRSELKKSITNVIVFMKQYKRKPNTVWVGKTNYTIQKYLNLPELSNALKNIEEFKKKNKRLPNYVTILGVQMQKEFYVKLFNISSTSSSQNSTIKHNTVSKYFEDKFGKYTTIDGALSLVNGKGYGYYYNDKFSNKQTIDNIAKKGASKPNCTDSCHVFWHIGKALGYEVRAVHVKCKGGDGHIRLQFKHPVHTGGKWINRDPACVLSANGKPVTCCWCLDGTVLDYNPQWFKNNLNR